jgi:hypothetical protein
LNSGDPRCPFDSVYRRAVCAASRGGFTRIWNGVLLLMPSTIAENL